MITPRKPHKKWDCPCTDCQRWYRDDRRRLVEALRELLADCDADMKPMGKHPARVLLRELGESE
jgi:hypothetical protein